ncbi:MAG TPA: TetR/AcrR family transcriptional regulator [Polyangiaceae bacterium]|nr:TetR/AcrR family transcriptional regulator [Polyangiaceae bacterium]HMR77169.1 TetR/AcrR family transcriptional regulator [Polyangiaceae bacterium]
MPRPRSDIRPRILRAARKSFLEHGVRGASLREIARRARTSIGMIYYYFKTKDDLFLAVVEEHYEGAIADLEAALQGPGSFEERLVRMSTRIGNLSALELTTLKLVLREAMVSSERVPRLVERFKRGHIGLIASAVGEGMSTGVIAPGPHPGILILATLAISGMPQILRQFMGENFPFADVSSGEGMARQLVDILMHGAAAPGTKAKEAEV